MNCPVYKEVSLSHVYLTFHTPSIIKCGLHITTGVLSDSVIRYGRVLSPAHLSADIYWLVVIVNW